MMFQNHLGDPERDCKFLAAIGIVTTTLSSSRGPIFMREDLILQRPPRTVRHETGTMLVEK